MADIIPKAATDYIKNKNLKVGFSYKDVWHEEHATGFTVAKAMQFDVLSDMHNAATKAVENGQSFETFKKNLKPTLQQKGWWGRKEMTDPLTGKTVDAQLGSDRRLKTIYSVNMRSAYQKGQYDRAMESDLHPYLMYRTGPSVKHRKEHESWNGLVLPKTDPWWDSHFPPNGWGCKCYTRAVTESQLKKYEAEGIPVPQRADGTGGGTLKIKTEAPPVKYRTYFNERKGTVEQVPEGVDPAFNWNQAKASRQEAATWKMEQSKQNYEENVAKITSTAMPEEQVAKLNNPGVLVSTEKELKQGLEEFKKHVQNMEESYKTKYLQYAETTKLQKDQLLIGSIGYDPDKDVIVYNERFLRIATKQQHANMLFSHELAHRYDVLEIKSWENKEFVSAIETAISKVKNNLEKYNDLYCSLEDANPALQDILSALSDNKIKVTYGHKSWTNMKTRSLEIFANTSYLQANQIKLPGFDGLLDDIMKISKIMFFKRVK